MVALPDAPTDYELIEAWQKRRCHESRAELCRRYEPLVKRLARSVGKASTSLEDLIQQGYVGLLSAIDKFDSERGNSFVSFAIPEVGGSILNWLRDHQNLIKLPRRVRRLNIDIYKWEGKAVNELGRWPTWEEAAEAFGVSKERVAQAIFMPPDTQLVSLNSSHNGYDEDTELQEIIGGDDPEYEESEAKVDIERLLSCLDERLRRIVRARYFEDKSQRDIAREIGLSQMQISRLLRAALWKMRGYYEQSNLKNHQGMEGTEEGGERGQAGIKSGHPGIKSGHLRRNRSVRL